MGDRDLVVVFDLLEAGYEDWWLPAFGLVFVGVGLAMVLFPRPVMELFHQTRRPGFYKFFSRTFLGFGVFCTLAAFGMSYAGYHSLRSAYVDGQFAVVAGPVEDYAAGGNEEGFRVAGQRFAYSDYNLVPGFNTTRAFGGPIEAGGYVRIAHVNGMIVRLEAERAAVAAARDRPSRSLWSPDVEITDDQLPRATMLIERYLWIAVIAFVIIRAVIWRRRGRPHIARDPALREGYDRMALGFAVWTIIPFLLTGMAALPVLADLPLSSVLTTILWGVVIGKWTYWTFFQDGASKLARHPGLIDHEWVAKLWPAVIGVGFVIATAREFF